MRIVKTVIVAVLLIILVSIALGKSPDNLNILGVGWTLSSTTTPAPLQTPFTTPPLPKENREIKIESFELTQAIYAPGDTAQVDFKIKNTLGVPYNITVNWFYDDERRKGWEAESTEYHNITETQNTWWSNITVYYIGDWTVQLVVKYSIEGYSPPPKDEVDTFKVR